MARNSTSFDVGNLKSKLRNLYCDICAQIYRLPRILPCLHSFCTDCISNLPTYARTDDVMWEGREDEYGFSRFQNFVGCETNATALSNPINSRSKSREFKSFQNHSARSRIRNAASEEHLMSVPLPYRANSGSHVVNKYGTLPHKSIHRSSSCKEGEFIPQYSSTLGRNQGRTSKSRNRKSDIYRVSSLRDESCLQGRKSMSYSSVVTFSTPERRKVSRSSDWKSSHMMVPSGARIIVCPKCSRKATVSADLHELPRNLILERLLRKVSLQSPEILLSHKSSSKQNLRQFFPEDRNVVLNSESDNRSSSPDYVNIDNSDDENEGEEDERPSSEESTAVNLVNPDGFSNFAHQHSKRTEQRQSVILVPKESDVTESFISSSDSNEIKDREEAKFKTKTKPDLEGSEAEEKEENEGKENEENHGYMKRECDAKVKTSTSDRIVKKLKLPKLYQFGKLFGFSSGKSSRGNSNTENRPIQSKAAEENLSQTNANASTTENSANLECDSVFSADLDSFTDGVITNNIAHPKKILDNSQKNPNGNIHISNSVISGITGDNDPNDNVFLEVNDNSKTTITSKDDLNLNINDIPDSISASPTNNYTKSEENTEAGSTNQNIRIKANSTLHALSGYDYANLPQDTTLSGYECQTSCSVSNAPSAGSVMGTELEMSSDAGGVIGAGRQRSCDLEGFIGGEIEKKNDAGGVKETELERIHGAKCAKESGFARGCDVEDVKSSDMVGRCDVGAKGDTSLSTSDLRYSTSSDYSGTFFASHTLPRRSGHLDKERMKNGKCLDLPSTPVPVMCDAHPGQELSQFCLDCEECVCQSCALERHSTHVCRPISTGLFKAQMARVDKLIRKALPKVKDVEQRLFDLEHYRANVKVRALEVTAEINEFVDLYLDAIEKHRENLLSRVAELEQARERTLCEAKEHLGRIHTDVQETCRFVAELLRGASSDTEILSVKRLITQRLSSLLETPVVETRELRRFLKFSAREKGDTINNFQLFGRVIDNRPSAATSYISGDGLSLVRVGQESTLRLTICGEDGVPCHGCDVNVESRLCSFKDQFSSSPQSPVNVERIEGDYLLRFTPTTDGLHLLHISLNEESIKGSPFKFNVKARWPHHQGTWHSSTVCATERRSEVPNGCGETAGKSFWSCCGKMSLESEYDLGHGVSLPSTPSLQSASASSVGVGSVRKTTSMSNVLQFSL